MILTASDVSSLAGWERAEYISEAFVIVACAGELVADLGRKCLTRAHRDRVERLSTILLVAALSASLICLVRTNELSGNVIGSLGDKAENADKKAENALTDSGTANTVASDAIGKSKVADDTSEHALALARSTEKYAAWRTISDKQADIIVKHLAPLEGHTVEMFDFTTDPETAGYAQRLGTVLGKVMHAHLSEYPGKFIPPPGLSFTVGKDREKDFALIVEALDVAGVEKASALRRAAEHRAPDDGIEINVGGKH
jgi:hypothetical protein